MIGIEGLENLGLHIILSKLDPNDNATLCCVNKKFRDWASDDSFWALHSSNDLNLSSPIDPFGNTLPSFKLAYQIWREAFSMYPWPLVVRVKKCWDALKTWLDTSFPEALPTLRTGASEEELNSVEKSLKVKLPLPTRLLYRLHDGQEFSRDFLGLVGGYTMYDHVVNVRLLPLKQVVSVTKHLTHDIGLSHNNYISVAASLIGTVKVFSLNCSNNLLYVGTVHLREDGEMIPCVPEALLKSGDDRQSDGFLLWLEEHVRRLESGMITIRVEGDQKSICQFPEKPPLCTTAVTNGVQVRTSAILVPEQSEVQSSVYLYAYSVRMSLLPEGCTVYGMNFDSCQLQRRHWIIRENEDVKVNVDAEAVIGQYPLLRRGGNEFVYQSCTSQQNVPGSIEGSFTFVPGRLAAPKGDPFKAEVARFEVFKPEYIF